MPIPRAQARRPTLHALAVLATITIVLGLLSMSPVSSRGALKSGKVQAGRPTVAVAGEGRR
eukprot:51950-Amorphochlora_amoeboformis.AAC.2